MMKPETVCKFHPKCTKSESCSFAHPQHPNRKQSGRLSSPKIKNEKPCRHFLRGKCAYGAECLHSHDAGNDIDTGANSTNSQSNNRSLRKARNSIPSSPVVSEDQDNAVVAGEKESCSLYLMGQCTVDDCEFDHPEVTSQPQISQPFHSSPARAALQPSSSSKSETQSPTPPTYHGRFSQDAQGNCADDDEPEEGETGVRQASRNDDHPQTRSSSKSDVTHQPPPFSSPTILQAPLTTRAPTIQVTQPTQILQQIVTPELPHYPHVSQVMLHWSQFADPLARAELAFCKLHAQDKCMKAELCAFRHSLTVGEYFSLFRDPQPTLVTLRREGDPIITEATITTIQPVIPAVIRPAPISVSPIIASVHPEQKHFSKECSFFRSGKCRNGDHCPYTHVPPQAPPPPEITTVELNEDDNWSPEFSQEAKINKPCKFFSSSYGYCRYGPDCLYLHQADAPQSTLGTSNEFDHRHSDGNQDHGKGWRRDKDDQSANADGDAHGQHEREDDQGTNEWTRPQDTSGWEEATPQETPECRNGQSSRTSPHQLTRPCYRFKEGTCQWGASCKYAHDNEPRNGFGHRSATRTYQVTNVGWSSTRQEDPFGTSEHLAMTPDSAETHGFEPWQNRKFEEDPENPLSPKTGDNNDDGNGAWAPAEQPTSLPHADPPAPWSQQAMPSSDFSIDAPEDEGFSSTETPSASTDIPHEPEELPPVSNIPVHPKIEKFIMNTTVSFGPAFVPVSFEPLGESRELRISNLPSGVSIEDVQALVQPYNGIALESTFRNFQRSTSIRVNFADAEKARNAFEYLHLQDYREGRKLIVSISNVKLRRPVDKTTLKISWPKPTLLGWSHYPTVGKAKDEAARLNGVIIKCRKIQVEFCSPDKRQKDNFAIKFSNLSLETPKVEIEELCKGHTLTTGFDIPTYPGTSLETIKEEFHSFGEAVFEKVPDMERDHGPNSFAFVTFPCEAMAQEAMTQLSSRKLSCIGDQCLEIKPVYFARYRVSRRIFDVVRQEIQRLQEDGTTNYTIYYDEILENYRIHLIALSTKHTEFAKANAELCSLLQGETARSDDGDIIWDDYFEMPSSVKALQHFLKNQANSIIPDEQTRRIRLFGSRAEQKRAMEPLLKLLSKVQSQRHEIIVPRGSMHSLIERFETIQKDMGVNKITFDVLSAKLIVRGTKERSDVQNLVDSLNSTVVYKPGCCEICHHRPDGPKIFVCLHVYCTPCLRMALRSASHGPLRCIAVTNLPSNHGQCPGHIPYIDGILPAPERDRLLLSSFLAHVRDSEDLFICPSVDCKAVHRTGRQGLNLQCSRCGTEICSFCQTLAHIGLSCEDMEGRSIHIPEI